MTTVSGACAVSLTALVPTAMHPWSSVAAHERTKATFCFQTVWLYW